MDQSLISKQTLRGHALNRGLNKTFLFEGISIAGDIGCNRGQALFGDRPGTYRLQAYLAGDTPKAALQILIHYGNTERPDKLRKLLIVGRLDGHQNLSE